MKSKYFEKEEERKKNLGIIPVIDTTKGTLTYGLYPQTRVKNAATIAALNALTSVESNGWYLYNGKYYAKKTAYPCSRFHKFDDGRKIKSDTSYWFKCEPIEWKILASNDGTYSLVSMVLLDALRYDDDSNNYANSEIRSWLNDNFLNTAFNLDSSLIQTTTIDNSASTTDSLSNSYACTDTEDKIYLLSYQDCINVDSKVCKTTDYARANGIFYDKSSSYYYYGHYWTRSPFSGDSCHAWYVCGDGNLDNYDDILFEIIGVRPALTIKL